MSEDHNECECGHEHEHEHEHHHEHEHIESHEYGDIYTEHHIHEEACVVSGTVKICSEPGKVRPVILEELGNLARAVNDRGGIIGHIKSSVETKSTEVFSVTDVNTDVMAKTAPVQDITIKIAAIVFAVGPEDVEGLVRGILESVKAASSR